MRGGAAYVMGNQSVKRSDTREIKEWDNNDL